MVGEEFEDVRPNCRCDWHHLHGGRVVGGRVHGSICGMAGFGCFDREQDFEEPAGYEADEVSAVINDDVL